MYRQEIESIANILKKKHGTEGALQYCKRKITNYEERSKIIPSTFNGLNEQDSHKIMIDFYISVSLILNHEIHN